MTDPEGSSVSRCSVYQEGMVYLIYSTWIYAFADLRELARQGKLDDPQEAQRILNVENLTAREVIDCFVGNRETLVRELGTADTEIYFAAMDYIASETPADDTSKVVVFDDENSRSECVYSVIVDRVYKRVVVVFRGSVTAKDWLINTKTHMKGMPNPVESLDNAELGVHAGFYEYLLGKTSGSSLSKCEKILKQATEALEQSPGYQLVCCGHSLGGALSTLFACSAAASSDPLIPKPVLCINYASPRVGNGNFKKAFQALEQDSKIVCLRVTNHGDIITKIPVSHRFLLGWRLFSSRLIFRHVGTELQLRKDDSLYLFIRPTTTESILRRTAKDMRRNLTDISWTCSGIFRTSKYLSSHSCEEYLSRLKDVEAALQKVTIDQVMDQVMDRRSSSRHHTRVRESICR